MNLQEIQAVLGNGYLDRVKMRLGEPRDAVAVRAALKITERVLNVMAHSRRRSHC